MFIDALEFATFPASAKVQFSYYQKTLKTKMLKYLSVWKRYSLEVFYNWLFKILKIKQVKKFIISATLVSLAVFYLSACKKSDKQQTTLERIQGVWQLDTDIVKENISGDLDITTTTGEPGDIVDFKTDGKVYVNIGGFIDTSAYSLTSDTKILIATQTFDITTLTANSFILYNKETTGASDYIEETITFKR